MTSVALGLPTAMPKDRTPIKFATISAHAVRSPFGPSRKWRDVRIKSEMRPITDIS